MRAPNTLSGNVFVNASSAYAQLTQSESSRTPASLRIGLKEWRILHAVVDCGTFASAANALNMSQPAVSYTVAKLEEQIGVPLFRQEGRKARITAPGSALIERSRALLKEAHALEEFATDLRKTWRQDIRLAVEKDFPTALLVKALRKFSEHEVSANVLLSEGSGPSIEQALQQRTADVAIHSKIPEGLEGNLLLEIELVPVAHPKHALFHLNREVRHADLEHEVRIISDSEINRHLLSDNSPDAHGAKKNHIWLVHNLDTAKNIVTEGLGYAWLPKHKIASLLEQGQLKILPMHGQMECKSRFYLIYGRYSIPVMGARHLESVLHQVVQEVGMDWH